ncbi:alpha/beta-hydrolase [Polychaeton citri CBS 116435]|uniref:Carboxylic ester hydrolase n=1 Tax=Polychaeton citri CBS 116435 TaxID=1314669 RepID=A0A9P4Q589_9PEZI|nr:alpha/beta-hydrolase [Polychaeton citri CBS 116435]
MASIKSLLSPLLATCVLQTVFVDASAQLRRGPPYGHPPPGGYDDTVVHLDYATYKGRALSNGINQWLGIPFASPPVGDLRFQAPQDPQKEYGVKDADEFGPLCLPSPGNVTDYTLQSEDCLFLNVYAPKGGQNLPVYFFIQGGGFATNSNANYNGSGIIEAGDKQIVVVNFNYRVGPYGFLAGDEVLKYGSINNGLKDQRKALEWVHKYISRFGGDPNHVTIGGDSAGAQSVNLQVTAYGGRDDSLFHASAAESQSFPGIRSVEESQYNYDNLVIRTGCADSIDTLACLRLLSVEELQTHNILTPFPNAMNAPLYPYGPVLDNDFIKEYTYHAYANGNYVKVPSIGGDVTNEGTVFVPRNATSIGEANTFIRDQWPTISPALLRVWNSFYPVESYPKLGNETAKSEQGDYYHALATGYGEMRYTCPGINISQVQAEQNVPTWNYRWNVEDPDAVNSGIGVPHTVEVNAIWGADNVNGAAPASYYEGQENEKIASTIQHYWASFIRAYDPNKYRLDGSPEWEPWTANEGYRRILMETDGAKMEDVPEDQKGRCLWYASIGPSLAQ